jgi:hypothetical protein
VFIFVFFQVKLCIGLPLKPGQLQSDASPGSKL